MPTSIPSPAGTPTAACTSPIPGVVRTIHPDHLGHEARDLTALGHLRTIVGRSQRSGVVFLGFCPKTLVGLAPALPKCSIGAIIVTDRPLPDTKRMCLNMLASPDSNLVELAGRFPDGVIFITPPGPNAHLDAVHELLGLEPGYTPPALLRAHDLAHSLSDRKRPTETAKVDDAEPDGIDA